MRSSRHPINLDTTATEPAVPTTFPRDEAKPSPTSPPPPSLSRSRASRSQVPAPPDDPAPETLDDSHLLALLLAGGDPDTANIALDRASQLLATAGDLAALPGTSRLMLRHAGLSDPQATVLLAACDVARRLARRRVPTNRPFRRPSDLAHFLTLRYQQRDQEIMGALFLDTHHRYLADTELFRGTLHRAAVEPRAVLTDCLLRGAAAVAIFHTHPSGDPTPSAEDILFTRRMYDAAAIVGVDFVDHLILGARGGTWRSLREFMH
jgi:DNA repair protein RadC